MTPADSLPADRILDAAREVFARAPYHRTPSLLDRLRLPRIEIDRELALLIAGFLLAILVALVLARLLAQARGVGGAGTTARRAGAAADPWRVFADHVASARWEAAAHALYAALIIGLGRDGALDPHPAKTPGDYARELRSTAPRRHGAFLRFVGRWERAVYGAAGIGPDTIESLRVDADALTSG